jgi:hypothetical protein
MHYGLGVIGKKNPRQHTRCGLTVPEANAKRSWKGVGCRNCLRAGHRLVQPVTSTPAAATTPTSEA